MATAEDKKIIAEIKKAGADTLGTFKVDGASDDVLKAIEARELELDTPDEHDVIDPLCKEYVLGDETAMVHPNNFDAFENLGWRRA